MTKARDEIAGLKATLRQCRCPYPVFEDETIGACVDGGHCGCCLGEPLMSEAQKAAIDNWSVNRTKEEGNG
jgi:hypothetical protein